eukprot:COSAG06_NODE_21131_length_768_cov_1.294469_2_plen_108_part_01
MRHYHAYHCSLVSVGPNLPPCRKTSTAPSVLAGLSGVTPKKNVLRTPTATLAFEYIAAFPHVAGSHSSGSNDASKCSPAGVLGGATVSGSVNSPGHPGAKECESVQPS